MNTRIQKTQMMRISVQSTFYRNGKRWSIAQYSYTWIQNIIYSAVPTSNKYSHIINNNQMRFKSHSKTHTNIAQSNDRTDQCVEGVLSTLLIMLENGSRPETLRCCCRIYMFKEWRWGNCFCLVTGERGDWMRVCPCVLCCLYHTEYRLALSWLLTLWLLAAVS